MNEKKAQLIVIITASYKGAVGFGDLFDCRIKKVLFGVMEEPSVNLTVLASDKDTLSFISEHLHPTEIKIGFTLNQKNEPYNLVPISGFVDKTKTSWRIVFIHEAKTESKIDNAIKPLDETKL